MLFLVIITMKNIVTCLANLGSRYLMMVKMQHMALKQLFQRRIHVK